jgi:hypothetical protein
MAGEETATERGRRIIQALLRKGLDLGFEAEAEYPVQGGRLDVVWLLRPAVDIPGLDQPLPIAAFEAESSRRPYKHIKVDYLNLVDMGAALGVIVLLGKDEVEAKRRFAKTLVNRPSPRVLIWSDQDVDSLTGQEPARTSEIGDEGAEVRASTALALTQVSTGLCGHGCASFLATAFP